MYNFVLHFIVEEPMYFWAMEYQPFWAFLLKISIKKETKLHSPRLR